MRNWADGAERSFAIRVIAWMILSFGLCYSCSTRAEFDAHGGPVKGIALSKDGTTALTASFDYSILHWNLTEQSITAELHGHEVADNRRALSASDDGTIGIWDVASGDLISQLEGHTGKVVAIALSPDERLAASAGWDRTVRLWDLSTSEVRQTLRGEDHFNAVAFAPDGQQLLAGSSNGKLHAWRVADGTQMMARSHHDFAITALDLSHDGQTLASASVDETVQIWDRATDQPLATLYGHKGPVLAVALSDDEKLVASGGVDGTVRVWRRGDGDRLKVYARHKGAVWAVAFAPDGKTLLSGGADGLVLTYNLAQDEPEKLAATTTSSATAVVTKNISRGEKLFQTCIACHTTGPDGGRKAGPTLHRLFGRKAGSHPDYRYSKALEESDLIWSETTVDRLFDIGPDHLLPGTKMPLQRMPDPKDRADLILFLKRVTTP